MSKTLVIKACKCMVKKDDGQVYIDYCPKHKAAPDLYEALKFAFPLFTHMPDCSQRITPDHACDCGYSEAISESGAALAKAQGE